MKNVFMYAYNPNSESAATLARGLGIKRIRHEGSKFRAGKKKVILNWGANELSPAAGRCGTILNDPKAVKLATHKLDFFDHAYEQEGLEIPEYTTDRRVAEEWLENDVIVFARTMMRANSGRGITIVKQGESLPNAPMYVKYIPKKEEYRVHVFNGEIIAVQRKALRRDSGRERSPDSFRIRNSANGYIFARNEDHTPSDKVLEQGAKAVASVPGLLFGAVDVIYNEYRDKAYVLEINTAPGLEGETVNDYINAVNKLLEN